MTRSNRPLAYSLRPWDAANGDMRQTAHLQCASCPVVGRLSVVGIGNNPDMIQKLFIRMDWDCDVHHPSENYCPKCTKQRAIRAGEAVAARKSIADGIRSAQQKQALNPREPMQARSSSPRGDIGIKSLTPAQKSQLRTQLDSTFDDSIGRYLEGNSDHKISELLGIPRATVEEFRENFYGELQDDPEISAFRMQLDDAKRVMSNLQSSINKMELKLDEISKKVGL